MDDPRSDTASLVFALREIAKWCASQSAAADEDDEHWEHVIRARALDEAANRLEEARVALTRFALFEEVLERAGDGDDNRVTLHAIGPCKGDYDTQQVITAGDRSGWVTLLRGDFRRAQRLTVDFRPVPPPTP